MGNESILNKKHVGMPLKKNEEYQISKILEYLSNDASSRRNNDLLSHKELQDKIGYFLEKIGFEVSYNGVSMTKGDTTIFKYTESSDIIIDTKDKNSEFYNGKKICDISGYNEDDDLEFIMDVKSEITTKDLEQIWGKAVDFYCDDFLYCDESENAQFFLGTDILCPNFPGDEENDVVSEMIGRLMENENVGVILVDTEFMIIYQNYSQFVLAEMPKFVFENMPSFEFVK